ncbi:hypothetical protein MUO14_18015 [Halobacillus shinanisalinarum]|uniref:Amidohydrolase n=1 Tax=Halobacillus shinanisalinarum TaxID=2932258 RepID=A0ABY4GWD1_9BACI|nr:hypothetical protein [Halobacillus shinanisalinarum]UOQ92349.1 hypothetical protein MUO14_18015 [Halobacillus shinanisalinarum]
MEDPMFGTEDFSSFSEAVPASMQFIGVHHERLGKVYPLHHSNFKIDEKALQYGVDYYVKLAERVGVL